MNDPEPDDGVPPLSDHQPKAVKVAELQASENNWKAWGYTPGPQEVNVTIGESPRLSRIYDILADTRVRLEGSGLVVKFHVDADHQGQIEATLEAHEPYKAGVR